MAVIEPGIYEGVLRHRRTNPKAHAFAYRVSLAFLDIDRLAELSSVSPFLSYERFNWISVHESDHLASRRPDRFGARRGDPSRPLRERLQEEAALAGARWPEGRTFLLTHFRYLGYCFNPVSYYYGYGPSGLLEMVAAEIHNTFGEKHVYFMDRGAGEPSPNGFASSFDKVFHISPFLSMAGRYRFAFGEPGKRLHVAVTAEDRGVPLFDAQLVLERRELSRASVHSHLRRFPLETVEVTAAIHWEALRLLLKGVPVFTHPKKLAARVPGAAARVPGAAAR
ncbi:MAG: DUF1365 domain-containing protein [Acidobacteria bacterium]|nr:DUF1365 domain-containing protein [Acidobacteriota bacterium]